MQFPLELTWLGEGSSYIRAALGVEKWKKRACTHSLIVPLPSLCGMIAFTVILSGNLKASPSLIELPFCTIRIIRKTLSYFALFFGLFGMTWTTWSTMVLVTLLQRPVHLLMSCLKNFGLLLSYVIDFLYPLVVICVNYTLQQKRYIGATF